MAAGCGGVLSLHRSCWSIDRDSRKIVANLPDQDGHLVADGRLYTGILPQSQNVANTAFDWSGRRWTMLVTPLPRDAAQRAALMLHEMWHRIQDSLGFPAASPTNDHLDQLEGRTWLRLEGHALRTALASSGPRRRTAITDALATEGQLERYHLFWATRADLLRRLELDAARDTRASDLRWLSCLEPLPTHPRPSAAPRDP